MPVLYLELDKETKDIKMQALHGLRHCCVNGGKGWVEISRHIGIGGSPPKVKAAQEAGPRTAATRVGRKAVPEGMA